MVIIPHFVVEINSYYKLKTTLDNCFHPRNQVIIWLGNMSFELYLIHLIFVRKLLIDGIVNVDQNICVAIIIAGTICISYMVKKWKKIIDQKIKCNRHSW